MAVAQHVSSGVRLVLRPAVLTLLAGLMVGGIVGALFTGVSVASMDGPGSSPVQAAKDTVNAISYRLVGRSVFRSPLREGSGEAGQALASRQKERLEKTASGTVRFVTEPVPNVTPFTNIAPTFIPPFAQRGGHGPGVCLFDYNRDGRPDIFVPNVLGNALYRNEGNNVFRDVAREAGVLDELRVGVGCVAFDYDNDGQLDLYVANRAAQQDGMDPRYDPEAARNTLFRNSGNGTFADVTPTAGVGDPRESFSAAAGDVNGDGYLDLYVSNFVAPGYRTFWRTYFNGARNTLYLNNRDGTFTDVTEAAAVGTPPVPWFDNDGHPKSAYNPNLRDRAGRVVGENHNNTHASAFVDLNGDRRPEILVAPDQGYLYLYRNDGPGPDGVPHFTDITHLAGLDRIGAWMGLSFADWDGDARLDFFASNVGSDIYINFPFFDNVIGMPWAVRYSHTVPTNSIFRNDGTSEVPGYGQVNNFSNVSSLMRIRPSYMMPPVAMDPSKVNALLRRPSGLNAYEFAFGTVAPDVNNDGWPDLYFAGDLKGGFQNGAADLTPSAGRLLMNHGRWEFSDISYEAHAFLIPNLDYAAGAPADILMRDPAKGAATGDLNGDGYPEILVGTTGTRNDDRYGRTDRPGPLYVFLNGGGSNHWLKIQLKGRMAIDGTGSNADGVGAVVRVTANVDGTQPRTQVLELQSGTSDLSSNEPLLLYGLGSANIVDRVEVLWPSGRNQILTGVPANQILVLTEPTQ